jgi:signal-transduction protein with cAMP-binding, CBS, and nucleotidyltransferase domain
MNDKKMISRRTQPSYFDFISAVGGFAVILYCIIYVIAKPINLKLMNGSISVQMFYAKKDMPKIKISPTVETQNSNRVYDEKVTKVSDTENSHISHFETPHDSTRNMPLRDEESKLEVNGEEQ